MRWNIITKAWQSVASWVTNGANLVTWTTLDLFILNLGIMQRLLRIVVQSLAIAEEIDDQKGHGNALLHLGNIYEKLADYEQAMDCYNSSLQIRRKIGDKKG
jgi:tetratricopeptide (TPR) repeat protein